MMAVRAVGKLGVNCPQMGPDRHMCRRISGNQPEICPEFAFHSFKLGRGLLPDAIMVSVVISPADLTDTGSLLLFRYHLSQIVPQVFRYSSTWRNFPDGTLKRTAPLVQFVGRQGVYRVLYRRHIKSP